MMNSNDSRARRAIHARSLPHSGLMAMASLCLVLAPSARSAETTLVVVNGRQNVSDGAQVCFRLDGSRRTDARVVVRVGFPGTIPRGSLVMDGVRSTSFSQSSQTFAFDASVGDVHRLTLDLDTATTLDRLSLAATDSDVVQVACTAYDVDAIHHVGLAVPGDDPVDRLEQPTRRDDRDDDRYGRDRGRYDRDGDRRDGNDGRDWRRDRDGDSPAMTIPAGTSIELTLDRSLSSQSARIGQQVATHLADAVMIDGRTALPAGTQVFGRVSEARRAGRVGRASLRIVFDHAILADGSRLPLSGSVQQLGKGSAGKQAGIIAGSAVGGALAGDALGVDPIIGAVVGGGIATGVIVAKPGRPIVLAAGTVLLVELTESVEVPRVRDRPWAQGDRD